jgi:hypothetical protein
MTKFIGNNITLPKLATAPSSPVSGDTYYDTTDNKPYAYNGTSWVALTPSASGAMNYAQTQATRQASISASNVTIVSTSITTNGYPVQVMVTGDAENSAVGGWIILQLYRDSTAIGKKVHVESSAGSENIPYALTVIDTPSAGAYTYALKTASAAAAGTFNFGETDGPVLTAIELTGSVGPTGPAVSLYSSTPAAIAATGSAGSATTAAKGDHVHEGVTSITGTSNQVVASAADGAVTLSLPQSIGTASNVTFNQVTASDYIALSGWNQSQAGRVGTSDTVTVTTAGTYYAIGGANCEVSFTPDFVGQKFFISMTGYASLNTTVIQYAFVRTTLTNSADVSQADLGFARAENYGTSGRGGTVAFSTVWTADTTSARKIKLYGTSQTTNGLVLTLAYWQLNVMALA